MSFIRNPTLEPPRTLGSGQRIPSFEPDRLARIQALSNVASGQGSKADFNTGGMGGLYRGNQIFENNQKAADEWRKKYPNGTTGINLETGAVNNSVVSYGPATSLTDTQAQQAMDRRNALAQQAMDRYNASTAATSFGADQTAQAQVSPFLQSKQDMMPNRVGRPERDYFAEQQAASAAPWRENTYSPPRTPLWTSNSPPTRPASTLGTRPLYEGTTPRPLRLGEYPESPRGLNRGSWR